MKTLLVFLLVIIAVSFTYASHDQALKASRISSKLRENRAIRDEIKGEKNVLSLGGRMRKHFSNIKDKLEERTERIREGDFMAKRSTNMIREAFQEKLQKLKALKEN